MRRFLCNNEEIPKMDVQLQSPLTSQQIRLLKLHPGKFGNDIACSTEVSSLESKPQYEALSYVWGDQNITKNITVDGRIVSATANLEKALQRLRYPTIDRILWVDALCIDQSNPAEKTQQIRLMQSIYNKCKLCLVWFGEIEDQNLEIAEVQALFRTMKHYAGAAPMSALDLDQISPYKVGDVLKIMMNNAWFSRMWTVQEIALPPTSTIIWGTENLHWGDLEAASKTLSGNKPEPPPAEVPQLPIKSASIFDFANTMYSISSTRGLNRNDDFWNTLTRFQHREATESRDRVFGLLGLMRLEDRPNSKAFSCDYDVDPEVLSFYLAWDVLRATKSLKPLIGLNRGQHPNPKMPSWATDWLSSSDSKEPRICPSFWDHVRRDSGKWYTASANTRLWMQFGEPPDLSLSLRGLSIDSVAHILPVPEVDIWSWKGKLPTPTGRLMEQLKGLLDPEGRYVGSTGISNRDAIWRTMIGDLITPQQGFDPRRWATESDRISIEDTSQNGCHLDIDHVSKLCLSCQSFFSTLNHHTVFLTKERYLGVGPKHTQVGDEAWIIFGSHSPFVVRRIDGHESERHTLVGECYVHGVMKGEAMQDSEFLQASNLLIKRLLVAGDSMTPLS